MRAPPSAHGRRTSFRRRDRSHRFTPATRGERVCVSPFTAWEIGKLAERGRLPVNVTPHVWFKALTSLPLVKLADLTGDILINSSALPGKPPNDPADRIMIATARELGLTIVTRDSLILAYAGRGLVRAIAC
ncbi:MAG: type II toxin-antitoxin system VapC family toxin [Asticcacaulis sp.]